MILSPIVRFSSVYYVHSGFNEAVIFVALLKKNHTHNLKQGHPLDFYKKYNKIWAGLLRVVLVGNGINKVSRKRNKKSSFEDDGLLVNPRVGMYVLIKIG